MNFALSNYQNEEFFVSSNNGGRMRVAVMDFDARYAARYINDAVEDVIITLIKQ